MGLSCGARALKFSLFIFNLAFLFCGIVCVCLGIWLILDKYAVDNLAAATAKMKGYEKDDGLRDLATKPTAVRQIGYLLLFGGIVVIVVAFLGCCGAFKEWRPLLCCYATCLMIILATEIAAAIYAAMHSHMFSKDFRQILHASLKMYNGTEINDSYEDDTVLVKHAWDKIMIEKQCCAVDSKIGEFRDSGWYTFNNKKYEFPPACCPPGRNGKLLPYCPSISRYGDGCYEKLKESLNVLSHHFKVVAWTAVFISLIQVFGIIVAFCLCDSITGDETY
ncbi:RE39068p [Strongyloides ratti]|uniref:Tetraspanin n=1 Tax=Strongyloides ratti TaxID=34506 RepID=A0A090KZC7_STRRB|nr:RE39068p [Strongyloides ratti]CEF62771.1 RE39068p [Strongyloides ratti]